MRGRSRRRRIRDTNKIALLVIAVASVVAAGLSAVALLSGRSGPEEVSDIPVGYAGPSNRPHVSDNSRCGSGHRVIERAETGEKIW